MTVAWVIASMLESTGALMAVLTPLVAVPLTVITFYLRSLREHQVSWHTELVHRVEALEASTTDLRKELAEFERDYATKEEWLRECMFARRRLEQLTETVVRIETAVGTVFPRAARVRDTGHKWCGIEPAPYGPHNRSTGHDEDRK